MNEQRRRILAYAVLVRRGLMTPELAAAALGMAGDPPPAVADPVAATLKPSESVIVGEAEPLLLILAKLEPARRDEMQKELRDLAENETAARQEVAANLPAAILASWDSTVAAAVVPGTPIPVRMAPEPRYTFKTEHARGGMGRVLIVADASIGRDVALKEILAPGSHAGGPDGISTMADNERFLREARITGQLEHPNIVPVHEIGKRENGTPYYTMKFVHGQSMADRLKSIARDEASPGERLSRRLRLLDRFVDVCHAVSYAHSRGVLNRDLKPANVMLGDYGETFVLDWGLAKIEGQEDRAHGELLRQTVARTRPVTPGTGDASKLTLDGAIMGTPSYMPPEQARGEVEDVDRQSDVYSLGAILYEILTGHAPFEGPDLTRILQSVILLEPLPILKLEPQAPRELAALAHRAMARDKAKRLPSARVLAEEVQRFRDGRQLSVYRYSFREQVARFARRNRTLTGAVVFALAALTIASAVSVRWARVASRESDNALRSLVVAKDAEAAARRASEESSLRAEREREAKEATQRALVAAEGQRLAAVATPIAASNPGQSLALAIESARRAPGLASNNAMLTSLLRLCEHRRLWEHALQCTCGTFSASGRLAASGGMDYVARIWDVEKGTQIRKFDDHLGAVRDVAFSPDSVLLATACDDGIVRLWSIDEGTLHDSLKGHSGPVKGARFVAGGVRVLSWSDDGTARSWPLDGKPPVVLDGAGGPLVAAKMTPDGTRVVTLSNAGEAILWNALDGRQISKPGPAGEKVNAMDVSPDGAFLATAGAAGHGDVWLTSNGTRKGAALAVAAPLNGALFSPDGKRLAFLEQDAGAHVVDAATFAPAGTLRIDGRLDASRISPDWSKWVETKDLEAVLRSTVDGSVIARLQGHDYDLADYAFSPDGRLLLTASRDRSCVIWNVQPGADLAAPASTSGKLIVALSSDWSRFVAREAGGRTQILELATSRAIADLGPRGEFLVAAARGEVAACPAEAGVPLRVIDTRDGATLAEIPIPEATDRSRCGFSIDGTALWNWSSRGSVSVWSPRDGRHLGTVEFGGATVITVSPGGRILAAGNTSHGTISLFDVASGKLLRSLVGHSGTLLSVAFFPDGNFLMSSAADASARVWDLATGQQVAAFRWPRADAIACTISPDGKHAALSGGGFIRIFEASTLREIFTLAPEFSPDAVAFTPDSEAFLFRGSGGNWRRVPFDLFALAVKESPRPITPSEMNRFEVGTEAERKAYSEAFQQSHPSPFFFWLTGVQAINAGEFDRAVDRFRRASALLPGHPDSACYLAQGLCALAKSLSADDPRRRTAVDEALDQLELAARLGCTEVDWARTDPALRVLDGEPRFKAIAEAFDQARRNK